MRTTRLVDCGGCGSVSHDVEAIRRKDVDVKVILGRIQEQREGRNIRPLARTGRQWMVVIVIHSYVQNISQLPHQDVKTCETVFRSKSKERETGSLAERSRDTARQCDNQTAAMMMNHRQIDEVDDHPDYIAWSCGATAAEEISRSFGVLRPNDACFAQLHKVYHWV